MLPGVCCAHEYTLAILALQNHRWRQSRLLERERADRDLRAHEAAHLPSTLALEKATNPFLRFHDRR
jgi:hydroxyacylglutathione hydrolase